MKPRTLNKLRAAVVDSATAAFFVPETPKHADLGRDSEPQSDLGGVSARRKKLPKLARTSEPRIMARCNVAISRISRLSSMIILSLPSNHAHAHHLWKIVANFAENIQADGQHS